MNTVSTLQGDGAATQKARLFEAGANKAAEIRETSEKYGRILRQPYEELIRNSLTKIIESDTSGIITKLEKTNTAQGLTAYLRSMLISGQGGLVRQFIGSLIKGNDLRNDSSSAIEANFGTKEKPIYQNARTLGFFAGSIFSATKQITDDVNKQAEIPKNIFSVGFGAAGAANPASGVTASILNGLTAEAVKNVVDGINNKTKDLRQALLELTLPPDSSGEPYSGVAKDAYNASFSATAIQNGFD